MTYTTNTLSPEMVADAKATLRARFIADRRTTTADLIARGATAYDAHLDNIRQKWIDTWISNHTAEPTTFAERYGDLSAPELYRASLVADDRIPALFAVGESAEAVKVFMCRNHGQVTLTELRAFLAEFIPIAGEDILLKDTTDHTTTALWVGSTYALDSARRNGKVPVLTGVSPEFRRAVGAAGLTIQGDVVTWRKWRDGEPSEF